MPVNWQGENIMEWLRRLFRGGTTGNWWATKEGQDAWMRAFNKRVPPVLDRYLKEIVEKTAYEGKRKASRQEIDSLIQAIRSLIKPVVQQGDDADAWFRIPGSTDADQAKHLAPHIEQFLRFPLIAYALLGYESISRFGYTADHVPHLDYVVARIMHQLAPESYKMMESMFNQLDATTVTYALKLEGYSSPASVLQRCRTDLIGVLYHLALPTDEIWWPNKRPEVSRWAQTYLESIRTWAYANNEPNLGWDAGGFLGDLERKQRYAK
ncbi:MAG: hypothetical protein HY376_03875 [Candidatus Blackburnbacteria bacterium]|nr:hypothetical protein [Candidatus Blackburnbacteria bacterium]